jgi:hypothetical protein
LTVARARTHFENASGRMEFESGRSRSRPRPAAGVVRGRQRFMDVDAAA